MISNQARELRETLDLFDSGRPYPRDRIADAARTIALPILEKQFLVVPYCLTHESTTEPVWVLHVETGEPVKVEGMYREDCNLAMYDGRAGRCVFEEFQLVPKDLK